MNCTKGTELERFGCCCECEHRLALMSHPWVDGNSVTNQIGFVCIAIEEAKNKQATLTNEHGCCELFKGYAK